MIPQLAPSATDKDAPSSAATPPNFTCKSSISSNGARARPGARQRGAKSDTGDDCKTRIEALEIIYLSKYYIYTRQKSAQGILKWQSGLFGTLVVLLRLHLEFLSKMVGLKRSFLLTASRCV